MSQRRYAETTDVPVTRSQGEVRDLLRKAGTGRIAIMDERDGSAVIMFEHGNRGYRLAIAADPKAKNLAQDERRRWRVLVLLVKAKVNSVLEGVTTIEREFFADTLMPSGMSLLEEARPAIEQAMGSRSSLQLGFVEH
jgi:hypothetical protein